MNAIRVVLKLHTKDLLMWFIAPWIFQLVALLVSVMDGLVVGHGQLFFSPGAGDIYVFYFVVGIASVNDTFPLALGFSLRRKDYFLGTVALVAMLSAALALVLGSLGMIESHVVNGWGVGLHFFALPYLSAGSFLQQCWVDFSLLVYLFSLGFVIGCVYRRFGTVGLLTFLAVVISLLSTAIFLNTYLNRWGALFAWFDQFTAFALALGLLPVTLLLLLAAYLLLRRAVV